MDMFCVRSTSQLNNGFHHDAVFSVLRFLRAFLKILQFLLDHVSFQAEIARQEARLKMEKENLEKEKSVLIGTASNQDNQDGALEITVSGEKYCCLRFAFDC